MKRQLLKRCLALCLSCVMALTLAVPALAADNTKIEFVTEKMTLHPGDEFVVKMNITGNPGFSMMQFDLKFDAAVLEFVTLTQGVIPAAYAPENGRVVWADTSDKEVIVKDDGTLFSMTFRVKDTAASGITRIAAEEAEWVKEDLSLIEANTAPLSLTIAAAPHNITFDANGGTGGATLTTGEDGTLKGQTIPTPANGKLIFQGWNTRKDGTGEAFHADKVFTADTTYYAQWTEKLPPYTITMDTNDGKAAQTGTTDNEGKLNKPAGPEREGYLFTGWYTEKTGGDAVDFSKAFTDDTTIYAQWKQIFTVTFDAQDGTTAPKAVKTNAEGKAAIPEAPKLAGYIFEGWFDAKEGGSEVTADTVFTKDTTVYARWSKICNIEFDVNGGTSAVPAPAQTGKGGKLAESDWPADPTLEGYVFDGWFTAQEGGSEVTADTTFTGDATLYARWSRQFTITFDLNAGADTEPVVRKTGKGSKLEELPTATRSGYTLDGWFTEAEGGEKVTTATVFTEDTTLFAHWRVRSESTGTGVPGTGSTDTSKPSGGSQGKDGWNTVKPAAGSGNTEATAPIYTHTEKDGKLSTGSRWIEDGKGGGHRYIFDEKGVLQTGVKTSDRIEVSAAGDLRLNGNIYYLNPERDMNDPSSCYVVTNYIRQRPNDGGQTFYDADGISFYGWMKAGNGGMRFQTRLNLPGQTPYCIFVWHAQYLPECQHPDHPGDAAYNFPAGWYLFDDNGVRIEGSGEYDFKYDVDQKVHHYTLTNGFITAIDGVPVK